MILLNVLFVCRIVSFRNIFLCAFNVGFQVCSVIVVRVLVLNLLALKLQLNSLYLKASAGTKGYFYAEFIACNCSS